MQTLSDQEKKVLKIIKESEQQLMPEEITEEINKKYGQVWPVQVTLTFMARLEKLGYTDTIIVCRTGREKNITSRGGMCVNEKEVYEICMSVDSIIADKLTESIIVGTSYDMLEAHYGILPISRRNFYRRKEIAQRLTQQKNEFRGRKE